MSHEGTARLSEADEDAVVAWAMPLWTDGRRHHLALHLSGYLAKQGVSREQAVAVIARCAVDDAAPGAKTNAADDTYDALEAGDEVSGYFGLRDVCGLTDEDLTPLLTACCARPGRLPGSLNASGRHSMTPRSTGLRVTSCAPLARIQRAILSRSSSIWLPCSVQPLAVHLTSTLARRDTANMLLSWLAVRAGPGRGPRTMSPCRSWRSQIRCGTIG